MSKYAIAIVGTASNVGKSTISTAICRYFTNKGLSVAPFKALNISLNSGVSYDSLEMGRSQIVQAQACRKYPSVYMNPILMKPCANNTMQVIVLGKVKTLKMNYDQMSSIVIKAYNTLKADHDLIVIEGSGSCCELNLKDNDLANFLFIERVKVNTILVANVENCGVFASVYGTLALLSDSQRSLIKGIIINKFQGDVTYFDEAKLILEDITGLPVLGVIPNHTLNIAQEDGLCTYASDVIDDTKLIDVVIIRLPHMSNADEFQTLHEYGCFNIRYINRADRIMDCDILIIPGSKNTMADLAFLREHGFFDAIQSLYDTNCIVFGICAGYQMLGNDIRDEHHIESSIAHCTGLELLNVTTYFFEHKDTLNTQAQFVKSTAICNIYDTIDGYEIHCGQTIHLDDEDVWIKQGSRILGSHRQNVYGSYLHGIFENEDFLNSIIKHVLKLKGVDSSILHNRIVRADVYDLLANHLGDYCDMKKIEDIFKEK